MPSQRPSKVIIDTNLWISFPIGKELQNLKDLIVDERIKLVTTDQLINELKLVTSRDKIKKYFEPEKVTDLIFLLDIISEKVKIKKVDQICRDPKDDFLLALSKESKADFLITGDKDLLEIKHYGRTEILTLEKRGVVGLAIPIVPPTEAFGRLRLSFSASVRTGICKPS